MISDPGRFPEPSCQVWPRQIHFFANGAEAMQKLRSPADCSLYRVIIAMLFVSIPVDIIVS